MLNYHNTNPETQTQQEIHV